MSEENEKKKSNINWIDAEGTFLCLVEAPVNGWLGKAGENATPYIRIPVTVIQPGSHEGKKAIWKGWLTEDAMEHTVETVCEVLGWPSGNLDDLQNNEVDWAGTECKIVVEKSDRKGKNGEDLYDVRWLNSAGGTGQMDEAEFEELKGRLNAATKAIAKGAKQGGKPKGDGDGGDDDKDKKGKQPF